MSELDRAAVAAELRGILTVLQKGREENVDLWKVLDEVEFDLIYLSEQLAMRAESES